MSTRLISLALLTGAMGAQAQGAATVTVPAPHPLGAVIAASAMTFASVLDVRPLSDGRLLVNDLQARTITMLDPSLAKPVVLLDSASGATLSASYGARQGRLLPFLGDSSLFYDGTSNALLVLDPAGKVARVMASVPGPPNAGTTVGRTTTGALPVNALAASLTTAAVGMGIQYSSVLGLVHHFGSGIALSRFGARVTSDATILRLDDSVTIQTMNPTTRAIDTIGQALVGFARIQSRVNSVLNTQGPYTLYDGWVVTADGSLAILRTREYRIDWINTDRTHTAGPRLPYPWHAFTDDEKTHLLDSVKADRAKAFEVRLAPWLKDSATVANGGSSSSPSGRLAAKPTPSRELEMADIPDFAPSYADGAGHLMADADNNVWILPRAANDNPAAPAVYDVVNRKSQIIDRVTIPVGKTVIGFGSGGIVYLLTHDAGRERIEKAHLK